MNVELSIEEIEKILDLIDLSDHWYNNVVEDIVVKLEKILVDHDENR